MQAKIMLTLGAICVVIALSFIWFYRAQTVWVESKPYVKPSGEPSKTLVVVYSRTGNTMGAAKEAAKYFDAGLLKIEAPAYSNDLNGWKRASVDANAQKTTTLIEHDPVDLKKYDLIILCSPTWWFRPAVPLWSFVENHDFHNKPVFLIMTGNSRYEEHMIKEFQRFVEAKNGNYLDKLFIQRGRIYWQKNPLEVNAEVLEALTKRQKQWQTLLER